MVPPPPPPPYPFEECPICIGVSISPSAVANSYKTEVALQFNILPPIDVLSDFEDAPSWKICLKILIPLLVTQLFS